MEWVAQISQKEPACGGSQTVLRQSTASSRSIVAPVAAPGLRSHPP